jgi:acetoin utilization deacetylase AcuC-like enzyme
MTLLYYDPVYLEHDTGGHPEKAERLRRVVNHLQAKGLDARCGRPPVRPVSLERLARIHDERYATRVREFAARGGGHLDADTIVSAKSYDAASLAAGAVCDAVESVLTGKDRRALCLVRPPGHHALADHAMGFCLFNNAAIAARVATCEFDLDRVLIVDWDVHHGNGTQDAFWEDEQVAFYSIHRWPFYPGTGSAQETGGGSAVGTKHNLPVIFGTSRLKYLADFTSHLQSFADKMRPQLILVSAGFDTHRLDPIGSLGLEVDDFSTLTRRVIEVAETHAQGRVVSVLEGGYNVDVLPLCVEAHLTSLGLAATE